MKDQLVLRIITKMILPFILMFGFYVQLHGEYSPGGGFQAGVIVATAFILYALIFGAKEALQVIPLSVMKILASVGVLLYGGTGVVALLMGGHFLEYSVLAGSQTSGQQLGIIIIELGIGITVCAVMLIIFFTFALRGQQNDGYN